jgi:hypothetical protein
MARRRRWWRVMQGESSLTHSRVLLLKLIHSNPYPGAQHYLHYTHIDHRRSGVGNGLNFLYSSTQSRPPYKDPRDRERGIISAVCLSRITSRYKR